MPELTKLPEGRKPMVRPHYPHMLAEDNAVWTRFLETNAHRIAELWYDVRVGKPVYITPESSELERKIAAGVSRKRIDVICRVTAAYWVVEVKPYASMTAVGQVITYARLFAVEYEVEGRIVPVIVCDAIDDDLVDEFDELGILVLKTD